MRKLICLLLTVTFGVQVAGAADCKLLNDADTESFKASDGRVLLYALAKPQVLKTGKKYPLVIFLHGAGGMRPAGERNPQRSWDGAGQFFETMTNDCYFFMPQANSIWSGIPWAQLPYTMSTEPAKQANQAVVECIDALLKDKKLAVDQERIYIAGVSMGSMGMWDLACRRPELFAAGLSCCGGFDATQAKRIAGIKFRMFHGGADNVVPEAGSKALYDALKAAGADVEYQVYPGANHLIWEPTYRNKVNVDWLFAQRRGPAAGKQQGPQVKSAAGDLPMDVSRESRTWTSKKGTTLEAKLLQKRGDNLVLALADGTRKTVDVKALSQDDQAYVKALASGEVPKGPAAASREPEAKEAPAPVSAEPATSSSEIGGLVLWLDASDANSVTIADGRVAEWKDASAGKFNASQSVGDFRPTLVLNAFGKMPMVRFVASGYQEGMHGFQPYLGHTLNTDCVPGTGDGPRTIVMAMANVGHTEWLINHVLHYGSPAALEAYGITSRSDQKNVWGNHYWSGGFSSGISSDSPGGFIVIQSYGDGVDRYTINGGPTVSNTVALKTAGGTYGKYGITIGARIDPRFGKPSEGAVFDAGEVMAFSKALSVKDRQKVEGYLAHKWGMADRLPAKHPYKSRVPAVKFEGTSRR
ncbi:MAG: prolyl oligopeptidase family serine peptidase [bacterium]